MRVVDPGHIYEVHNVDDPHCGVQKIIFVRRRGDDARLISEGRHPGILSQELIRILIDRTIYLNTEAPCLEDVEAIDLLRRVLRLYESRAARRTIEKLPMPEMTDVCERCHHILCRCDDSTLRLEHGIER